MALSATIPAADPRPVAWVMGRTYLPPLPPDLEERLAQALTLSNPGYAMAVQQGKDAGEVPEFLYGWDRWDSPCGSRPLVIPNYFTTPELERAIRRARVPLDSGNFSYQMKCPPRATQGEVVQFLNANSGDIGLKLPCGFGKTYLALGYASRFPGRVLVVLPNVERLEGWKKEICLHTSLLPEQIGHVQASRRDWQDKAISVCMLKTLAMQTFPTEFMNGFSTVIWDEAHLSGAPMMSRALGKVNGRQVALTATPGEGARRKLIEWHVGQNWKTEQAHSRKLTVHFLAVKVATWAADKEWRIQKLVIAKDWRYSSIASSIAQKMVEQGRRVLVLNDLVQPLITVANSVKHAGQNPGFVVGQASLMEIANEHFSWLKEQVDAQEGRSAPARAANYFHMVKAQCNPILATGLKKTQPGGMGMDVATLDGGVVMFPVMDKDMTIQLAGRWARDHADKQDPILYVLVPDTRAGHGAAARMKQHLTTLPDTEIQDHAFNAL